MLTRLKYHDSIYINKIQIKNKGLLDFDKKETFIERMFNEPSSSYQQL